MATRTLNLAAALAWLLACAMLCVLAFDPLRSEAARVAVVACALADITVALGLTIAVHWRLVATEQLIEAITESLDATLQVVKETHESATGIRAINDRFLAQVHDLTGHP